MIFESGNLDSTNLMNGWQVRGSIEEMDAVEASR